MNPTPETVIEQPPNEPTDATLIDELTGLGNRASLHQAVTQYLSTNTPTTLVLLDLDEFRVINDSLGHAYGDRVLQAAARRLSAVFGDQLFRPGGDEFAVVLPTGDPNQIDEITDIVLTKWRTPLIIDGAEIYSGVSIGTVTRGVTHQSADCMIRDGEIAMYEAKRLGRNRAVAYRDELGEAANEELERQMLGRRAVVNREFHLFWQPIFDAQAGHITACEALLRWRPAGGRDTLSAAEFIPFLERSGLIIPVGEQVIDQALQQYAQWSGRYDSPINVPVSMNVSARQLESGGVVDSLLESLDDTGINGSAIIVEIPESIMGTSSDRIKQDLQRLRSAGVRIAVEDFGGGQASLLTMDEFPMDIVKLHRSAVTRIAPGEENPMLDALRGMAKSRGLTAVVTGVENQEQLGWFQRREWNWVQGYFVAEPQSAEDMTEQFIAQRAPGSAANAA